MALRVGPTGKVSAGATLRDFKIRSAAELGLCTGAQSFRAVRRSDGAPVLLHKFRPAHCLLDLEPLIEDTESPDFTEPFLTRFTGLFAVAGSAYLVEPLPVSLSLSEVWRYVLLDRADQAPATIAVLTSHLLAVVRRLAAQGQLHGAVSVDQIVLTSTGRFGAMTASIRCARGRLWLRRDLREPVTSDYRALAAVLRELLDMEAELAYLRNTAMFLAPDVREEILRLARAVEHTGAPGRM